MRRSRDDAGVTAALERAHVPGADEAEARAWEVVGSAYEHREPAPRAQRRGATLALAVAGVGAALVVGLSPAGARVGDLVTEVGQAMGIGVDDARPALRSLPAAGELLVRAGDGMWIVREDGSKRRLGDYRDAAWSPRGRFVAVATDRQLFAVDPAGEVRWALPTNGPASDLVWGGTELDTRIAYRVGRELRVVAGDGTGDHPVARDSASAAPLWVEWPGLTKVDPGLAPGPDAPAAPVAPGFPYALAYVNRDGEIHTADADTGAAVDIDLGRAERVELTRSAAPSPVSDARASVAQRRGRATLSVVDGGDRRVVFSGSGEISAPVWSPDGRWLAIAWREADQWLFIEVGGQRRVVAIDEVGRAFDAGPGDAPGLPRPLSWVLPDR